MSVLYLRNNDGKLIPIPSIKGDIGPPGPAGADGKDGQLTAEQEALLQKVSDFIDDGGGGVNFTTDESLTLKDGVLSVNVASEAEEDNTLPISSAAVATTVGNIEILLKTI